MKPARVVKISIGLSLLASLACKTSTTQSDGNTMNPNDAPADRGAGGGGGSTGDAAATCIAGGCGSGQLCVHYVNPPGRATYSMCRQDPCAAAGVALSCDCASSVCEGAPGCSAGTGEVSCLYSIGAPVP